MDIIDQIGGAITNTGRDVAQKAKNFAEISKLNDSISLEEQNISNLHNEIGKLYFKSHSEDQDAEFVEQIVCIKTRLQSIQTFKQQIQKIKGSHPCESCGKEVTLGSAFCSYCGHKCIAEAVLAAKKCPSCGASIADDDIFCMECGTKQ